MSDLMAARERTLGPAARISRPRDPARRSGVRSLMSATRGWVQVACKGRCRRRVHEVASGSRRWIGPRTTHDERLRKEAGKPWSDQSRSSASHTP
jgi:hypothetical protein